MQWQDDEQFSYPDAQEGMARQQISDEEYEAKQDPSWYINNEITQVEPPPPLIPPAPIEDMAILERKNRDDLLRSVYDPGINIALRALRMASTPEQTSYAEAKVAELDIYAEALLDIPEQPGFPLSINWPVAPIR